MLYELGLHLKKRKEEQQINEFYCRVKDKTVTKEIAGALWEKATHCFVFDSSTEHTKRLSISISVDQYGCLIDICAVGESFSKYGMASLETSEQFAGLARALKDEFLLKCANNTNIKLIKVNQKNCDYEGKAYFTLTFELNNPNFKATSW